MQFYIYVGAPEYNAVGSTRIFSIPDLVDKYKLFSIVAISYSIESLVVLRHAWCELRDESCHGASLHMTDDAES